jgi:hypothetical protein
MIPKEKEEHFINFLKDTKARCEKERIKMNPDHFKFKVINTNGKITLHLSLVLTYEQTLQLDYEGYKFLLEKAEEQNKSNNDIECHFEHPRLTVKSYYVPLGLKSVKTDEPQIIMHAEGQVYVVAFWANWCETSIQAMNYYYKLITNNLYQWNGKVNFIGVSIVDDTVAVGEFIHNAGWNKFASIFQHYTCQEENWDYSDIYGAQYIPHIAVIDKQGIIQYLESPVDFDLEEKINNILDDVEDKVMRRRSEERTGSLITKYKFFRNKKLTDEISEKIVLLFDFYQKFRIINKIDALDYFAHFNLVYVNDAFINDSFSQFDFGTFKINFDVEFRKKEFGIFIEQFTAKFGDWKQTFPWLETKFNLLETFDINLPKLIFCNKCTEKVNNKDGVYFCYWCKIFFCEKCTEGIIKKKGKAKLIHPDHNLLYFTTRDTKYLSNLDLYKLGNNLIKDAPESKLKVDHSGTCNGCNERLTVCIRFICISCRPGKSNCSWFSDYCEFCFEILRHPDDEDYKKIKYNYKDHNHSNHVYLRLVFNVGGYYDY